jgi:HAD superfamily hydrolase (TIGR01509 family)
MIEALIFDCDGVLMDSMHLHAKAWKTAFAEAGIEINEKDIYWMEGANDSGVIEMVLKSANQAYQKDIFESVPARKHELFSVDEVTLFDGIDACLKELRDNLHLAVVSGSDRNALEKMTGKFLPDIFDVVISGNDVSRGKPHPEPYTKAVEDLGICRENCIVVENAPLGVQAAKAAGLFCIGLPTYVDDAELKHADIVLKDHTELIEYLKQIHDKETVLC